MSSHALRSPLELESQICSPAGLSCRSRPDATASRRACEHADTESTRCRRRNRPSHNRSCHSSSRGSRRSVRGSGPREKVRTSIERCRELRAHFHQRQRALFRSERENFLMGSRVARSKLNSGVAQIALQALQQRGAFMSPSSDDSNAVSKIGRINILRILELTVEKTPLCQFAFSPRHSLYFDAAVAASGARSYRRKCVVG
jgi:hypothetical protein